MRIYVFEHRGTHLFILAGTESQARAVLRTHCSSRVADEAAYVECGMSFTAEPRGHGDPYTRVEVL